MLKTISQKFGCIRRKFLWRQLSIAEKLLAITAGVSSIIAAFLSINVSLTSSDSTIEPEWGTDALTAAVQYALSVNGLYDGVSDGFRNPKTARAIGHAQTIVGMSPTGHASEELCKILEHLAQHREMILPLQIIFFDRGEIRSGPDGVFSLETRFAIKRAELEFGLGSPDGLPDDGLFLAMVESLQDRPLRSESLLLWARSIPSGAGTPPRVIFPDLHCSPVPSFEDHSGGF